LTNQLERSRDELRAELEHWWKIQEQQRVELAELRAQNERLRAALEQINRESGQVCPEFETCSHGPCQGSSAAKLIALEALGHHNERYDRQPTDQ